MQLPAEVQGQPTAEPDRSLSEVRGLVDNASQDRLYGWVFDAALVGHRFPVELRLDGRRLAVTMADLPRADLAKNGIGDGNHAFEFAVTREQMARQAEFSVVAKTANGQEVALPIRIHQPQPPRGVVVQAPVARLPAMRDEVVALAQRVATLPDAAAIQALLDQNARAVEALRAGLKELDQRLATLPDAELMQRAVVQQDRLAERMNALEVWLDRLDRRLAEAPTAPQGTPQPMAVPAGRWQYALFGGMALTLVIVVVVGLLM